MLHVLDPLVIDIPYLFKTSSEFLGSLYVPGAGD